MNVDASSSRLATRWLAELPADLDSALPGLARALDPADVVRRFERQWPGSSPAPSISACTSQHIRWTPGAECVGTFRLTLAPSPPHPRITIGVVAVGRAGDRHYLFEQDTDLPGLEAVMDTSMMSGWFAEHLGHSVDWCAIAPVTYRPGRRCVLSYTLASGGAVTMLYGKILAGDRGRDLASTVASLGEPIVAPLVAVAPEWQLIVQADAGRRGLASDVGELRACGRLLARLHARRTPPGRVRLLADDANDLRRYLPAAQRVSPLTGERLASLIERLQVLEGPSGPPVPSHGAFRLDQVCFGPAGPALIDLDSYCWADPARDLANVLAYLRWREIRHADSAATTAKIRAAIIDGYTSQSHEPVDQYRLRAFEAASLLKIAGRRYRRLAVGEWDLVPDLIDAALDLVLTGQG